MAKHHCTPSCAWHFGSSSDQDIRECNRCGLKMKSIDNYIVDQDALDHIREKHQDLIVDMIDDVFVEVDKN